MIKPTIGRVVLYRPDAQFADDVRHAATVAHVHTDGTVNLSISDSNGVMYNEQRVTLVQDDDVPDLGQCEWMAYQKEQAAKNDDIDDSLEEDDGQVDVDDGLDGEDANVDLDNNPEEPESGTVGEPEKSDDESEEESTDDDTEKS